MISFARKLKATTFLKLYAVPAIGSLLATLPLLIFMQDEYEVDGQTYPLLRLAVVMTFLVTSISLALFNKLFEWHPAVGNILTFLLAFPLAWILFFGVFRPTWGPEWGTPMGFGGG